METPPLCSHELVRFRKEFGGELFQLGRGGREACFESYAQRTFLVEGLTVSPEVRRRERWDWMSCDDGLTDESGRWRMMHRLGIAEFGWRGGRSRLRDQATARREEA